MRTVFVIQDVRHKDYYWEYKLDKGFYLEVKEACKFDNEEEALKILEKEDLKKLFSGRFLSIEKIYILD